MIINIGCILNFTKDIKVNTKINMLLISIKFNGFLIKLLKSLKVMLLLKNVVWATKIAAAKIRPTITGLKP